MNEISIVCSSEGVEVSVKSSELTFKELEERAIALLERLNPGQCVGPEGYHS